MKIYTKAGDNLQTTTKIGKVYKSDLIIEIEGTLDEVETVLAVAKAKATNKKMHDLLNDLIKEMFNFGSDFLGYSKDTINSDSIKHLEDLIDLYQEKLPKTSEFIIPGENETSAFIHLARVNVRKLERRIVEYAINNSVNSNLLSYINRLSDLLFVLARSVELNV